VEPFQHPGHGPEDPQEGPPGIYTCVSHPDVLIFQFLLPVTHERALRRSLDKLFYTDTLEDRLSKIPPEDLLRCFPLWPGQSETDYRERLVERVGFFFGGYSVSQVEGRFRMHDGLLTREEAAKLKCSSDYLEDERTLSVTFIFPCSPERPVDSPDASVYGAASEREAEQIRFLFHHLFVKAVLESVTGEHEIWLLEGGMRTCLWKFILTR